MACCSRHRLPPLAPRVRAASGAVPTASATGAADRPLTYRGDRALALRGPVSGRIYHVGPSARRLAADPRDVGALERTGLFAS